MKLKVLFLLASICVFGVGGAPKEDNNAIEIKLQHVSVHRDVFIVSYFGDLT
jgi:hypothetical protein